MIPDAILSMAMVGVVELPIAGFRRLSMPFLILWFFDLGVGG